MTYILLCIINFLMNGLKIPICLLGDMINVVSFLKEDKGLIFQWRWSSEFILLMGLILFFMLDIGRTSFNKKSSEQILLDKVVKPLEAQSLFRTLLPTNVYKISRLNCLGLMINQILFTQAGVYLIQPFKAQGVLGGDIKGWGLKLTRTFGEETMIHTIKNPMVVMETKVILLKELIQLYGFSLTVEGHYVYDEKQLGIQLGEESKKLSFIKEEEFQWFLKQISSIARIKQTDNEEVAHKMLYFVISMRYLEYLRGFYQELSLVDKVHLSSSLSRCSKELLAFFVSPDFLTMKKIQQLKQSYLNASYQSLKSLQTVLFEELNEWALEHPDLEFIKFNEEVLVFAEGFCFVPPKQSKLFVF